MKVKHSDYKPLDYDLFFGMDVDKRSITISVYSHDGFVKTLHTPYGSQLCWLAFGNDSPTRA